MNSRYDSVTGAAGGLGRSHALPLTARGANVAEGETFTAWTAMAKAS